MLRTVRRSFALSGVRTMSAGPAGFMPRQPLASRNVAEEVAAIENEWASNPRWSETARPYSAKDVVSLRGSIQQTYAADAMSKKLYATLLECQATGATRAPTAPSTLSRSR